MVSSHLNEGERLYCENRWDLIEESHKDILLIEDPKIWSTYLEKYGSNAFIDNCIAVKATNALKWASDNNKGPLNVYTIALAVVSGHLEVVKYT